MLLNFLENECIKEDYLFSYFQEILVNEFPYSCISEISFLVVLFRSLVLNFENNVLMQMNNTLQKKVILKYYPQIHI